MTKGQFYRYWREWSSAGSSPDDKSLSPDPKTTRDRFGNVPREGALDRRKLISLRLIGPGGNPTLALLPEEYEHPECLRSGLLVRADRLVTEQGSASNGKETLQWFRQRYGSDWLQR